MTLDDAMAAFTAPGTELPKEAMQWALDHWDEAGPRCAALLEAYASGQDRSEGAGNALFPTIHLQAEKQDASAFAPLCRLLADPEAASLVLGDAITETLSQVLISTYDGDHRPLVTVIEAVAGDDFIRSAALDAMAYLTRTGRIAEQTMRSLLLTWLDELQPRSENMVWEGWVMAVANLGYTDLAEAAESLLARHFVDPYAMNVQHFRDALQRTLDDEAGMAGFAHEGTKPFGSAIEALDGWANLPETVAPDWSEDDVQEPFINPLRGVGRNDPCPCGSGKKYKKCCLV